MKCPKCKSETTIQAEEAAHDETMTDVKIRCDSEECDWSAFFFIYSTDWVP